jgi:glycosyltransferase involved in cell wall biosynthesis
MRILFISNFYPPARPGGYSQWCHEVALGLEARGHRIGVLTSNHDLDKIVEPEKDIFRVLHLEGDLEYYQPIQFFASWNQQQEENEHNVKGTIERFSPDLVFIWGMWAMSKSVPAIAEKMMPSRVVYFLSDYWPASVDMHTAYWQIPARRWYARLPKKLLSGLAFRLLDGNGSSENMRFENAICVSMAVRDILVEAGLPFECARVIHGGTDVERFGQPPVRDFINRPLRLLYAGQLVKHKGVHTAIEALSFLVEIYGKNQVNLNIVGSGHPGYEAYLRSLASQKKIDDVITFAGAVPKEKIPMIMEEADVLVFPSVYEEPFARMTQEAMLAGLVVVGTTTGGTKEILIEGANGLTFEAKDAKGLANQLAKLVENVDLCQRLSQAGRETVLNSFTLEQMVDEIEEYLNGVMNRSERITS